MPAATLPLLLNVFVAGMFVASFMMIAYLNPDFRRVRWIAMSYAIGMFTPISETILPLFANPAPFKILSYGSFLTGLALIAPALSIFYRRGPVWIITAAILVMGGLARWLIWNGPRDELWYELLYQSPFACAMLSAAWVVRRHGRGHPLDAALLLLFVLAALHFPMKAFAAASFGSGETAAVYLHSRYAMISQTVTGVVLIALGLVLLMNVLQTVIASNRADARTDALTGLPNRRALFEEFQRYREDADPRPLSLAILDIDLFKSINDQHGHQAGDLVLQHVAKCLAANKPTDAIAARIGGEEFVVLLPQDLGLAFKTTENLRLAVNDLLVTGLRVTLSAGLTAALPGEDLADVIRRADRGLYRAKTDGRNRSVVEPVPRDNYRPALRIVQNQAE